MNNRTHIQAETPLFLYRRIATTMMGMTITPATMGTSRELKFGPESTETSSSAAGIM